MFLRRNSYPLPDRLMYKNFKHQCSIQIRFADLDSLNHVNNANYLSYIELARIAYFKEMSKTDLGLSKEGIILAKATIDFKVPVYLNDEVLVFTRCNRLGNKSFDLEYEMVKVTPQGYVTAATATTVLVAIDYTTGKTIALPDAWRKRAMAYEGAENIVLS